MEGNPPTPSVSPERADFRDLNRSSSNSSGDSRTSSNVSNSNDSGDLPAVVGRPARDLEVFGEHPALQSGRTRSQPRGLTMSVSYADALLAYAMRAVEAKMTMEEEAAEIERAHDSLLEERLEKEREWFEELERRGTILLLNSHIQRTVLATGETTVTQQVNYRLINASSACGHKEVPRSTGHIVVTTRYSDQQGSKSRQNATL